MISINEALANNVTRIRVPKWACCADYLELTIIKGKDGVRRLGPWIRLFSPMNEEINGENPVSMLITNFDLNAVVYEIWEANPHLTAVS